VSIDCSQIVQFTFNVNNYYWVSDGSSLSMQLIIVGLVSYEDVGYETIQILMQESYSKKTLIFILIMYGY